MQFQNRGKRMIEGAHINRSLLALANCINALVSNNTHYVNYRDSKLTRLLKDALGGNCVTVMIAHISPASTVFEESRNTLGYAERGKRIKNKVRLQCLLVAWSLTCTTLVTCSTSVVIYFYMCNNQREIPIPSMASAPTDCTYAIFEGQQF